jgi:NAD(P)H dehydrogenase (quinone)
VSDREQRAEVIAAGFPAPVADIIINIYQGIADGQLSTSDGTLRRLIGRPTTTLEETLRRDRP